MAGAGRKVEVEKTQLLYYYLTNPKFIDFENAGFISAFFALSRGKKHAI